MDSSWTSGYFCNERSINIKIFQPASPIETGAIIYHCIQLKVPSYIRISRQVNKEIYIIKIINLLRENLM